MRECRSNSREHFISFNNKNLNESIQQKKVLHEDVGSGTKFTNIYNAQSFWLQIEFGQPNSKT